MATTKTLAQLKEQAAANQARSTLISLFDEDSFTEISPYSGQSAVTGWGQVEGNLVYAFMQDISVKSGAICKAAAQKIVNLYGEAVKNGAPVVGIYDSKGGDISEGVELLQAYGEIAKASGALSGVAPQISVISGVCGGTAAILASMADFVVMTEKSELFLTAPFLDANKTEGAGTAKNAALSGVPSFTEKDTAAAVERAKALLSVLPQNNLDTAINCYASSDAEVKDFSEITGTADVSGVMELYKDFGKNSKVYFASSGSDMGKTEGVVYAGDRLSSDDTAKIARFAALCDSFSIPIVTVLDCEGFEVNSGAELTGSVRSASKLAQVYAAATVPKIAAVSKALGGAFNIFCGANADITIADETAVIAPSTPKSAAIFLYGDKLNSKEELEKAANDYAAEEASALNAMEKGAVDIITEKENFWSEAQRALEALDSKRVQAPARKHINFVY